MDGYLDKLKYFVELLYQYKDSVLIKEFNKDTVAFKLGFISEDNRYTTDITVVLHKDEISEEQINNG